jgi:hypothetical protein
VLTSAERGMALRGPIPQFASPDAFSIDIDRIEALNDAFRPKLP